MGLTKNFVLCKFYYQLGYVLSSMLEFGNDRLDQPDFSNQDKLRSAITCLVNRLHKVYTDLSIDPKIFQPHSS